MSSKENKYIRDGRSPIPDKILTSKVMSANKGKNTKPEILLRRALWRIGIRGYRLHWKNVPGSPDIAFPKRELAIFVNGCYWHRCPYCDLSLPKSNTEFWEKKFTRNKERDREKIRSLKKIGWNVVVIWECMIKKDILDAVNIIKKEWENYGD
jgi:DNA mismatch endonuclease, patch repair protein